MQSKNRYPREQIEFLQAVLDMREAQRQYFKQPTDYRLKVSLKKEQRVDALLQPFINERVIKKPDEPNTGQLKLM